MKSVHILAYALLWIGGINWGLIGLLQLNLVNMIFGSMPTVENLVYILVGAAALYTLSSHMNECKVCSKR